MDPVYLFGVGLTVLAAVLFAFEYICARMATDGGQIVDLMVVSLLTNVALIVPLVFVWHGVPSFTPISFLAFVGSGLFGSLFARLCMFWSVDSIGASRTSPIIAANVFFATVLAIVLLGEQVTVIHATGIVLIVVGVAVISWETASNSGSDRSIREIGVSILVPVIAAALVGFEPILVSVGLAEGTTVLSGTALKVTTATIGFLGYLRFRGRLRRDIFRSNPMTKWYVGAGAASALGIVAFFSALDVAPVVIVVPLFQTAPLLVLVISAAFLPQRLERVTWRLTAASVIVVVGAMVVTAVGGG